MNEAHPTQNSRPTPPRHQMAPMGVGDDDVPARESARQSERVPARGYHRPEPHEKYELLPEEFPPGMDLNWLPITIAGAPNDKVGEHYREGWQPVTAETVPRISGYGTQYPESMIKAGLLKNVEPDAPIIIDGQMLVMRPQELSRRAARENASAANSQVANQMARLSQSYRNARGVGVRRNIGAMPAIAPQGDEEI